MENGKVSRGADVFHGAPCVQHGDGWAIQKNVHDLAIEGEWLKMQTYKYRCKRCGVEWEEKLTEEKKLDPTKGMQPEQCDVYIAPHSGVAECDVELIE